MNNSQSLIPVDENEILARFIYHHDYFRQDGSIRPSAFEPNCKTNDVSVFRHSGFSDPENDLSRIGEEGARNRGCNYHGRADIKAEYVYQQRLDVVPTQEPENHANIVGWPEEKNERKSIALELAANCVSRLKKR